VPAALVSVIRAHPSSATILSSFTNLTALPAALSVARDAGGSMEITVSVKATFVWGRDGVAVPAAEQCALRAQDQFGGDPGASGVAAPADVGPRKPKVDVLLAGAMAFPAATTQADVALSIGGRLRKVVRVFGDRVWLPTGSGPAPSRPAATDRVPIEWERSFGGADPEDPALFEPRNPVGTGMARQPRSLEGRRAPNFEDPRRPVATWKDRPDPIGFGAIAPHWPPRVGLAGTYDEAWQRDRCPLLPADFDAAFFNAAPADQQLDAYVAGEIVELDGMTVAGRERFALPALRLPVVFRSAGEMLETFTRPDTVVIEPAERRFSVVARAAYVPRPNMLAMREVVLGPLSRGRRRALESGKVYLRFRAAGAAGAAAAKGAP
jgi:hypothetical protein